MYNYTNGGEKWKTALTKFIKKQDDIFYPPDKGGVMTEPCERRDLCNYDQESFKGYLARWLGTAIQMAPFTYDLVMPKLSNSAIRAAQTCDGPSKHNGGDYQCGMRWYQDGYDGKYSVGSQMCALNIVSVLNAHVAPGPASEDTGGTSKGNPGLNTNDEPAKELPIYHEKITTADKMGAAIITIMISAFTVGGAWWMMGS
jgi:hypothetical protein